MNTIRVKFQKLDPKAVIPSYAHSGDVGMDLAAISVEYDITTDTYIYHTGLACATHENLVTDCQLRPRSSNCKTECYLTNSVGTIDSDTYRGEIQARFKNRTSAEMRIKMAVTKQMLLEGSSGEIRYNNLIKAHRQYFLEHALDWAPYKVGDRVAQLVFTSVPLVQIEEVDELDDTERGASGFGSSN